MTDREAADPAAVAWARDLLGDPAAAAELLRARPWSATWRIRSGEASCFLKATGPASHYEAPLMRDLSARAPSLVPAVLGSDGARGWLLLADAGPTLHDLSQAKGSDGGAGSSDGGAGGPDGGALAVAWEPLLARFARLQRTAEPLAGRLLAAGVPDERPERLGLVLDQLLAGSRHLRGLRRSQRGLLERRPARWHAELSALGEVSVPASIQHGDLHDNNVAVGPDGETRFFDFGDATVAHPFMTMLMPLHIASVQGASRADLTRMRTAYVSEFADLGSLPDLHRVLDAALRLAWLIRATAWDRALTSAPADHAWGDPVPETLGELITALS
jgi:hypothetical protein